MAASKTGTHCEVRAAIVGCGPIGARHAAAVHEHPTAIVRAVCDPAPERRQAVAARYSATPFQHFSQLIDDADCNCAFIASPDTTHVDLARQALQAGWHVFSEKPFGYTAAEARELAELATDRDLRLGVDFNRRFAFGYQQARRLLDEGSAGELRQIWLQVSDGAPPRSVAVRKDVIFWTLLTHHLDLISFLGGNVRRLHAAQSTSRGDAIIDQVALCCELRSGVSAFLTAAYRGRQSRTVERCELVCRAGGIIVDEATHAVRLHGTDVDDVRCLKPDPFEAGNAFYESLRLHIHDFVNHLTTDQPPSVTAYDAAEANKLAEAAMQSHDNGDWVVVRD